MKIAGDNRRGGSGLRGLFAVPDYRRLWAARTVSQWGDVASTVALGLLVLQLTGSGLGVAGVVAAEIVPVLVLAPIAGVVVDRFSRRQVMIAADLGRAALMAMLPFAADHVGAVYLIAAGMSAGSVFFNPAAGAVLPALVARERLVAANSGIWTAAVLSQIALAPITGLVVTVAGVDIAFWVNAVSFLLSAALLARLPALTPEPETDRQPTVTSRWAGRWTNAVRGVRHIRSDRRLGALAIGQALAALSAGATSALLVVYVRDHLHAPPTGYGITLGAIGVGAAAGPLLLVRLIRDPAQPGWVFGPFAVRGGVDLVLASVSTLPPAALALAAYGVSTSTGAVTFNSMLQATVPDTVRGRVMATFDITWQAGRLASLGIGGLLADQLGIRAVYYLGGVLLILAATMGRFARTR
ncbi:MFS transporter [Micromonospora globbae]|uniref:MFS transporter n=1 Tax=Micromonospora globbae TaxID=1894969 RepID=UPI0034207025